MSSAIRLPPGPRAPRAFVSLGAVTRQRPYLEKLRARYGDVFSAGVLGLGDLVVCGDPALIKQVFTTDPKTLHAGTGSPLGAVLGAHSLLAIDEDRHMEQRKLLLPPFHGDRMKAYEQLIADVAAEEVDRWPAGRPFATGPSFMRITLRAILRAVFGAQGAELEAFERLIPPWVQRGSALAQVPWLQRDLGPLSPWGRFVRMRAELDRRLDDLIAHARRDEGVTERTDVLSLLVQATHEDGSPMTNAEIRDQLLTLLAAGHETTAATLAWAVERLTRLPDLLGRLAEEADAGGKALREATVREVQRVRPVVSFSGRMVRRAPYELGEWRIPEGVVIGLSASLTHNDPRLFAEPERFRPERFLETKPETYAWIPFGGGRRRCIGAAFAHLEMDVVLRTVLERVALQPTAEPPERWSFRGVTYVPARGGRATVARRSGGVPRRLERFAFA